VWRDLAKEAGRYLGLEISRYRPAAARREALLREKGIEMVLDVGASTGQYALELRRFGYAGRIVSFEPLSTSFGRLNYLAAADPDWECHQVALGESDSTAKLAIASNFASSSLLPMLDRHRHAAPGVSVVGSETVQMRRLDSLGLPLEAPTLMKLDVQGYEDRVLRGADGVLFQIGVVECEVSIEPLYEAQLGLREMLNLFEVLGFGLIALEAGLRDRAGRIVQYDAMLVRTSG
jgi:FkbM family methyltransferase